jgi:hypothetical protein
MDAWLTEYVKDGNGTSIILTRSNQAQKLIEDGMARGEVSLQPIEIDKVINSQAGVVEQKRKLLAHHLWISGKNGFHLRKRVPPVRPSLFMRQLLIARETIRATSHKAFTAAGAVRNDQFQRYIFLMKAPNRRRNILFFILHCRSFIMSPIYKFYRLFKLMKSL